MATYKPKKKIDKNGTLDDIKFPMDSIYGLADEFKKKGVHFISDSDITVTSGSSSLSEKWVVNGVDGITEPFDGMLIAIRIPSRGSSPKGVVLSINGGNNYNSLIIVETGSATSFYSAYQNQATILFSFNAIRTGTAYLESGVATNITGCWQTADRDNNYIVTQFKNSEDKEKPILTKYSDSTSTSSGPTSFGLNVTINHAKGRLSATELRENGVSLSEKYALKDEVGGSNRTITAISITPSADTIDSHGIDCSTVDNCEIEYDDGNEYVYPSLYFRVPITAGEGIEFVEEENKTVSINATGGAGLENVEMLDMYMGMVEPPQTDDGIYWVEKAQARNGDDSVIKEFNAYHHIPIVSGEGVKFEQNEEQGQVKISTDLPTVKAKLTPASEVGGSVFDKLGNIDTWMDLPYDIFVAGPDGVSWNEAYVFYDKDENIIASGDMAHRIPLQAGEGIEFVPDTENNVVKINANALKATTQNEFDSLIVEENEDKTITYKGKLYVIKQESNSTSIGEGTTFDTLYFNTNVEPDFSQIELEEGTATLFSCPRDSMGAVALNYFDLGAAGAGITAKALILTLDDNENQVVYATEDFSFGNLTGIKGWNVSEYNVGRSVTVDSATQIDACSDYVSTEPFSSEVVAKEVGCGGISGAWTSGTSGSIALPSAGLYELKAPTFPFGLLHTTLYWDGSAGTLASFGGISGLPAITVSSTGVITTLDPNDLETPFELALEYRKIGEA